MDEELIRLQDRMTDRGVRSLSKGTKGFLNPSGASIIMPDELTGNMKVFGKCMRQRWYKYHHFPEDPVADPERDLNSLMRMRWGNIISEDISDGFKQLGELVAVEVPVVDYDLKFSGRIDRITIHPQYGTFVGWEDKAYFTYWSIKSAFGNKSEAPKVKIEYQMQTALYAWITEKYDISDWRMLHTNMQEGAMRQDFVRIIKGTQPVINNKPTPWTIDDILEREEVWHDLKEDDKPPQRDFELNYSKEHLDLLLEAGELTKTEEGYHKKGSLQKGDFACRYCPFAKTCWKESK